MYVPQNKWMYPYQRCIKKPESEPCSQMFPLDSGFNTTGVKSVYMSIEVLVLKLVRGGWEGNLPGRGEN